MSDAATANAILKKAFKRKLDYSFRCPLSNKIIDGATYKEAMFLNAFARAKQGDWKAREMLLRASFTDANISSLSSIEELREHLNTTKKVSNDR